MVGVTSLDRVEKYENASLLDALKMHFQRFFATSFLHSMPNGLNRVNINLLTYEDCGSVIKFSVIHLAETHNHLISSNKTYFEN